MPDDTVVADEQANELGDETLKFLSQLARESFGRYNELDESVWRSLPFFAATFGLAATVISYSATKLPQFQWSFYASLAHLMLIVSIFSFGWAFRWFWLIIRPKSFEYPADDSQIRSYAESALAYYRAVEASSKKHDGLVLKDLHRFVSDQFGKAAETNAVAARERLTARTQALLFMMIGFLLAFFASVTIFVHDRVYVRTESAETGAWYDKASCPPRFKNRTVPEARATEINCGKARSRAVEVDSRTGSGERAATVSEQKPPVVVPSAPAPARPSPPPPQRLEKGANVPGERR